MKNLKTPNRIRSTLSDALLNSQLHSLPVPAHRGYTLLQAFSSRF